MNTLNLGISACLLGSNVRYNGGHKLSRFCRDVLGLYASYTPFCPEVEAGLGVPRPTIRLIQTDQGVRAAETDNTERDHTDALAEASEAALDRFVDLDGYVLMQKSPSCGMERVKVYQANGYAESDGVGVFARALRQRHPLLPVEEAGRLEDAVIREHFLTRLYVYQEVRQMLAEPFSAAGLIDFHARHKYLLMAYDVPAYRRLGRQVSQLKEVDGEALQRTYFSELMAAIERPVSRGRHVNVMHHLMGYLKKLIDGAAKHELLDQIARYQRGVVPLVVPLTLLLHHMRRFPEACDYVLRQRYLSPYPEELGLRSWI